MQTKTEDIVVKWTKNKVKIIPTSKGQINLLPGYNNVHKDKWDAAIENGLIKEDIENKRIIIQEKEVQVTDESGKKKKEKSSSDYKDLDKETREEIIKETFDLKSLAAFRKKEEDNDLLKMIVDRIDEIKNNKKSTIPLDK